MNKQLHILLIVVVAILLLPLIQTFYEWKSQPYYRMMP